MFSVSSERKRQDRNLQRAAANRRVGHDHAYLILFGPVMFAGFAALLLTGLAVWAWFTVDHDTIAGVIGAAGILTLVVYLTRLGLSGGFSTHRRMMALATGSRMGWTWHLVGVAGVLLLAAAVLIWQGA